MQNIQDYLGLLNRGLQMLQQQDAQAQAAAQPKTPSIVEKARTLMDQVIRPQPVLVPSPDSYIPEFAGNMMNPLNGDIWYEGKRIASPPRRMATGGAVNSAGFYYDPLSFIQSRWMQNPQRSWTGNPAGSPQSFLFENRDSLGQDLGLFKNTELPDYMRNALGSAATNMGDYGGIIELVNRVQRMNREGAGQDDRQMGMQAQQWLNSLGTMAGSRNTAGAGAGGNFMGGQQPNTDAYGRPLSGLKEGEQTAIGYPGNWFTYGYGPEFNFMYYGGQDAFNPQATSNFMLPQNYAYGAGGTPTIDYFQAPDYSQWMSQWGFADGGKVRSYMEDFTPMPPTSRLRAQIVQAVKEGRMEDADRLDQELQRLEMVDPVEVLEREGMEDLKRIMLQDLDSIAPQRKADGGAMKPNMALRGATPGKADEIPAMLSDGEHVIPAWAVAAAGDGNSEAGHKFFDKLVADLAAKHQQLPTYNAS